MNLLGIGGSPRKGNSQTMLEETLRGAEQAGVETEIVLLRELNIAHCDGNDYCLEAKECRQKDDFQAVAEKMEQADSIVLATPTYFDNMSGLMKDIVDRSNYLYAKKSLKGKKGYAVISGGGKRESLEKCLETIKSFYKHELMEFSGAVLGEKLEKQNAVSKNDCLLKKCFELGKKIAEE